VNQDFFVMATGQPRCAELAQRDQMTAPDVGGFVFGGLAHIQQHGFVAIQPRFGL
jgi:hypothetical protein